MKKNIVGAIVATVTFTIIYLLLDLIFGDTHSFREYAVQAVIFCFVWCLGRFLDDRGWNSWKRIGDLFKRKKMMTKFRFIGKLKPISSSRIDQNFE